MNIEGRVVRIDTTRFDIGSDQEAVVMGHHGNMTISSVTLDPNPAGHGKRFGFGPWKKTEGRHPLGATATRAGVWVVGAVID